MNYRREDAKTIRDRASQLAYDREHPHHCNNGEEFLYRNKDNNPSHIANFTKGLPHCFEGKSKTKAKDDQQKGLLENPDHYQSFVLGIQSGDPKDFERTPLGPPGYEKIRHDKNIKADRSGIWQSAIAKNQKAKDNTQGAEVRAWESAGAGHTFDLQGPDAQAVTMPPAPKLNSDELTAEMAEVYLMALLRDIPFTAFKDNSKYSITSKATEECKPQTASTEQNELVGNASKLLAKLAFFKNNAKHSSLSEKERTLRTKLQTKTTPTEEDMLDLQSLFRGIAPGDDVGPYLSQFIILGNTALSSGGGNSKKPVNQPEDGLVRYGALNVDQRVRTALPKLDYMTTFEQWIDVQNGADLRGAEQYANDTQLTTHPVTGATIDLPSYRFIATPRDLATYVHYDALYEAYLNACLFLLAIEAPFDPGLPFQQSDKIDKQQGFAQFGGPHILSLVTEVATRALKAVRYQKFNIHRRARPEAIAGLIDLYKDATSTEQLRPVRTLADNLFDPDIKLSNEQLMTAVANHNNGQNQNPDRSNDKGAKDKSTYLLPMAFPEGSPMHPSYGAGHATVAGACVTVLKAYFDHGFNLSKKLEGVWEPNNDGTCLQKIEHSDNPLTLTVEGELNKLASNIAIGRNWAGVHYYTDYIESFRMGEKIAIGILEENKLMYSENFTMTVPLLNGSSIRI